MQVGLLGSIPTGRTAMYSECEANNEKEKRPWSVDRMVGRGRHAGSTQRCARQWHRQSSKQLRDLKGAAGLCFLAIR